MCAKVYRRCIWLLPSPFLWWEVRSEMRKVNSCLRIPVGKKDTVHLLYCMTFLEAKKWGAMLWMVTSSGSLKSKVLEDWGIMCSIAIESNLNIWHKLEIKAFLHLNVQVSNSIFTTSRNAQMKKIISILFTLYTAKVIV